MDFSKEKMNYRNRFEHFLNAIHYCLSLRLLMRTLTLCMIIGILSSCLFSNEDKKCYRIESIRRTSTIIGVDGSPFEKTREEYYIASEDKQSAVVIGYAANLNDNVNLYVTGNSCVKLEHTFPIDDTMQLELLKHVLVEITNKCYNVKDIQLSMKTCGIANLNIAKKYWMTRRIDKKDFHQPAFTKMYKVLERYGYNIYDITIDDFYPLTANELRKYHIIPDTFSQNCVAIDGIITLKCKGRN